MSAPVAMAVPKELWRMVEGEEVTIRDCLDENRAFGDIK